MRSKGFKILWVLILFVFTVVWITACDDAQSGAPHGRDEMTTDESVSAPSSVDGASPDTYAAVAQSEMWRVELVTAELTQSLTTTKVALQYGGGVLETTSELMPSSGYNFLILGLIIEKTGVGRAAFSWGDAHVVDREGNIFFRHPNDTFLTHLNIPRLRGTDMVFGEEYGYVCFEIPFGSEGLRFVADEGNIVLDLSL
ncbi:MAG: hypothetical protein FWC75_05620 [Oscillospiraceae bacterium]|nr:hypothetical protein [Oscillospiraceae bacterium]